MTTQDKIKRLKVYLEKCVRDSKDTGKAKSTREFFEREVNRTLKTIEKLS
jgi:hypothetical protein